MEYEKASAVLKTTLNEHKLAPEEKEAIQTAIGLLTLGVISKEQLKNRLKNRKALRDKETRW